MLIHFVKFFHLLSALGLLGIVFLCWNLCRAPYHSRFRGNDFLHRMLFALSLIALITGTLLVYPKNYTFHTPWIKAAYLLLSLFIIIASLLNMRKLKNKQLLLGIYSLLIMMLLIVAHDAVRKSTFLFPNSASSRGLLP